MHIELKFKVNELLYDIKSTAYTIADSSDSDNEKAKRNLKDIGEDNSIDRVTRIIELELAIVRERLYSFTHRPVSQDTFFNNTEKSKVYCISLDVPDDFSQTTADLMEKLIHEFIVFSVIAAWLGLTSLGKNSGMHDDAVATADEHMEKIKESLSARTNKVHIKISPF